MPIADIDFEGTSQPQINVSSANGDNPPKTKNDDTADVTPLDGNPDVTNISEGDNKPDGKGEVNKGGDDTKPANSSTGELAEGDTIEFENATYTVDKEGNLVDKDGKVFKPANEVKDWIKSVEVDDSTNELNITNIQEGLGITITDEDGKPIEFTNNLEGVSSYISSVIDIKSQELQQAAVNKLFNDNPILKQFADYVAVNGTAKGFGDMPDRSGIELDKDNVAQLESIIKMAAEEFGNKSLNQSYINYLRDSGGLYDEAKNQLEALIEKDKQVRANLEVQAKKKQEEAIESNRLYWKAIKDTIDKRVINGFKLPESFTKEANGQKLVLTPNDFFDYLSKATVTLEDGNKISAYQADLNKLSDEEYRNRELLEAWLMFTGGSYKDLISMVANENKVQTLKLKAKEQNATKSIKVIRKQGGKVDFNDIILS